MSNFDTILDLVQNILHTHISLLLLQQQASQEKLVVLRKHRQRIKSEANWKLFYYQFNHDHARPNLIWNFKVLPVCHLAPFMVSGGVSATFGTLGNTANLLELN